MVTGIYPTEQRPHKGTFIKTQVDSLIAEGLEVEVIHPKPGPVPLRYAAAAIQVFFKSIMGRFDVVHGHYGLWCLVSRMQWTTPVVASFLGDDLLGTVTDDGSYSKKGAFVVRVSHWLSRRVDAVIVKSEGMKKKAPPVNNIFVIPNGVDFELFRPMSRMEARALLGWDPDRYYILFCNDPEIPVKNFPLAKAAIEWLQSRGIPAELVVANGIAHDKVVQYMNASNALILPSFAEGSPNVVKEAMACNLPVVATKVGDVSQVIGDTSGCSICAFDAEDFADGLEDALRHVEATSGRSDIAHLEISAIAKQVIGVYELIRRKS
jgi:glycosyltransferase involved in cell wall biosynthesis